MWSSAKAAWKMVVMEGASSAVAGWSVKGMLDYLSARVLAEALNM